MSISRRHAQALRDSAVNNRMIRARGYETLWRGEAGATRMDELGFQGMATWDARRPGLLIPALSAAGTVWGYQYRPDSPRADVHKPGKVVKYENPRGQQMRLDFPLGLMDRLADRDEPLIVTEGAKKADAAMCAGYAAVALLGVTIWKTHGALEDWHVLPMRGRDVFVCFDSDAVTKADVQIQERALAKFLIGLGARVHLSRLASQGGGKVGLDDFIAAGGDVDSLLAGARPVRIAVTA